MFILQTICLYAADKNPGSTQTLFLLKSGRTMRVSVQSGGETGLKKTLVQVCSNSFILITLVVCKK